MQTNTRRVLAITAFSCFTLASVSAQADTRYVKPDVLKVCQDPHNMPFSNEEHEGIENRIAEVFGQKMGIPVEYFSFPQRLAFVRNTIRYKVPGQDYRCDIMMGVPERFGQVSTTDAYYRSTYALVYRKDGTLAGVSSGDEFIARAGEALQPGRLGLHDKSPASAWLNKHALTSLARLYPMMSPDPGAYPGQLIERDLAGGTIDAAVVWGPIAGYFAHKIKDPELVVVPLESEPGVRFDYAISMGVRHGEPEWKNEVQRTINSSQAEIMEILHEFHVPLVNEIGDPIKPRAATASQAAMRQDRRADNSAQPQTSAQTTAAKAQTAKDDMQSGTGKPDAESLKAEHEAQVRKANEAAAQTTAAVAALAKASRPGPASPADKVVGNAQATSAQADQAATAEPAKTTEPTVQPVASTSASPSGKLYTVKEGTLVDADTYAGFKTWRAAACDRCHGAEQQGLVGPSLLESLKVLTHDEFVVTVRDGRLSKGMQSFGNSKKVMDNIDHLYAYLKGRSDGAITQAKVKPLQP